ncbi:hypothetical protein Nepgr_026632 [Nepenthes gracilis]|uniref:Uncharacterized protein n=1 Tax=Nepenthes gracilis TaxID=150966 RepID=A0AAD3T8Q9_NEPGR|nr:hypothetical protein Nepgr_026632 [Nepenthes gracilis]
MAPDRSDAAFSSPSHKFSNSGRALIKSAKPTSKDSFSNNKTPGIKHSLSSAPNSPPKPANTSTIQWSSEGGNSSFVFRSLHATAGPREIAQHIIAATGPATDSDDQQSELINLQSTQSKPGGQSSPISVWSSSSLYHNSQNPTAVESTATASQQKNTTASSNLRLQQGNHQGIATIAPSNKQHSQPQNWAQQQEQPKFASGRASAALHYPSATSILHSFSITEVELRTIIGLITKA